MAPRNTGARAANAIACFRNALAAIDPERGDEVGDRDHEVLQARKRREQGEREEDGSGRRGDGRSIARTAAAIAPIASG